MERASKIIVLFFRLLTNLHLCPKDWIMDMGLLDMGVLFMDKGEWIWDCGYVVVDMDDVDM